MPDTAHPLLLPQVQTFLDRIDQRLAEVGKTRHWLSMMATGRKSNKVFVDIARRGYLPKQPRMNLIADALGVSVDWLIGVAEDPAPVRSEVTLAEHRIEWRGPDRTEPGIPLVGTGDCAALEVCSESGQVIEVERNSFDPDFHQRYLERPPALRGMRQLYAIYFHGDSMWHRFKPGEHGIVDPVRPVAPGDEVLVQLSSEDGSSEVSSVLVKALVRQTAREVTLRQYNPDLTFTLSRSRVVRLHRILSPADAIRFAV